MNFVAIDFKTANDDRASICSIGLAIIKGGRIVATKYWLIQPNELCFQPATISIHGITKEDVINKPTFNEVWPELLSYLRGNLLLAYDAIFDMGCLREVLTLYHLEAPDLNFACTLQIAQQAFPGLANYRLSTVADYLSVDFTHHHREQDALACAVIALRACDYYEVTSLLELIAKINVPLQKLEPNRDKRSKQNPRKNDIAPRRKEQIPISNTLKLDHPLFDQQVVFTGKLESFSRRDAMQRVIHIGGYCGHVVGTKTRFLVVGKLDPRKLRGNLKSNKLKKAERILQEGGCITLLHEDEFLTLLKVT